MSTTFALSDHQRTMLSAARDAPSILNTQPWKFRLVGKSVELHADRSRQLTVTDARGRQLAISCGAALFNLRIAARHLGYEPVVRLRPEPSRPDLLATVELGRLRLPTRAEERLYGCVPLRHTARTLYAPARLAAETVAHLEEAAGAEGASLRVLPRAELAELLELVNEADTALREREDVRAELTAWVGADPARGEGLPPAAFGVKDTASRPVIRDFAAYAEPTSEQAAGEQAAEARPGEPTRPSGHSEPEPNLMLLSTPGDEPVNWLRAGQALQRVLLEITSHGLVASFLTQPLEVEQVREKVRDPAQPFLAPQMVLRAGHGAPGAATPRRPLEEILLPR